MATREIKVGLKLETHFDGVQKAVMRGLIQGLMGAMDLYRKGVLEQVALVDEHTLKELAKMGHPYAKRKPKDQPHPDEVVHQQSGALAKGFRVTRVKEEGGLSIGLSHTSAVVDYLIFGTATMRPRRFHVAAFFHTAVAMRDVILANVKAAGGRRSS